MTGFWPGVGWFEQEENHSWKRGNLLWEPTGIQKYCLQNYMRDELSSQYIMDILLKPLTALGYLIKHKSMVEVKDKWG